MNPAIILSHRLCSLKRLDNVRLGIDHLIFKNTISPFRIQAIGTIKSSRASSRDEPHTEALQGLVDIVRLAERHAHSHPTDELVISTCQLLRLAITYSKSLGKAIRNRDNAWLETLFLALAKSWGLDLKIATNPNERQFKILQSLLEVASTEGIPLSPETLSNTALKSALVPHELLAVRWSIISYLFDIDSDIFTNSLSNDYMVFVQETGETVTLLESLILGLRFQPANIASTGLQSEQRKVVKQMLSSFVQARNLMGFLEIWQRELSLHIRETMALDDDGFMDSFQNSIWLESNLSDALKDVLESALIPQQIKESLEQFTAQLALKDSVENSNMAITYANSILMDILIKGLKTERVRETLLEAVWICYQKLSQALENWSHRFRSQLWSLLRSLRAIYFDVQGSVPLQESEGLLSEAMNAIMTLGTNLPTLQRSIGYPEAYQAFCFISSIHVQSRHHNRDKARTIIEEIINIISSKIESREDFIRPLKKSKQKSKFIRDNYVFSSEHENWNRGAAITGIITALLMEYISLFMQVLNRLDISKLTLNVAHSGPKHKKFC